MSLIIGQANTEYMNLSNGQSIKKSIFLCTKGVELFNMLFSHQQPWELKLKLMPLGLFISLINEWNGVTLAKCRNIRGKNFSYNPTS